MLCEELMTQNPKCCAPTDTAVRVARMMKIEDVGSLPVCSSGESRRLIGSFPEALWWLRVNLDHEFDPGKGPKLPPGPDGVPTLAYARVK